MAKLTPEVKKEAAKIFAENPTIKTLYVNNKGEFFTTMNLAQNSVSSKTDITEIHKDAPVTAEADTEAGTQTDRPNVKTTVDSIKAAKTLDELKAFDGDDRTTVQTAYDKRLKELEAVGTSEGGAPAGTSEAPKADTPAGTGEGNEGGNAGTGEAPEGDDAAKND